MAFSNCAICGELKFDWQAHTCKPRWEAQIAWDLSDFEIPGLIDEMVVFARDEEQAAEKAVEKWEIEASEYDVAAGRSKAYVRIGRNIYEVSGETLPSYHAAKMADGGEYEADEGEEE